MPEYRRWTARGATYFFTAVTYRRRRLFHIARNREMLRCAFKEANERFPFEMYACVLLPEHLHCIWILQDNDDGFSKRWAVLKSRFTQHYLENGGRELPVSFSRSSHNERGVWQSRFWEHMIRDERELIGYRDYIHLNPVKHGHVEDPTDWPWSSVHRFLRSGTLERDWTTWTQITIPDSGEPDGRAFHANERRSS